MSSKCLVKNSFLLRYPLNVRGQLSCISCFSTKNVLHQGPRRSPIVKNIERKRQQGSRQVLRTSILENKHHPQNPRWPVAVIQAAVKSGALSIDSQTAVRVLDDFQGAGIKSAAQLCTVYQIKPVTLSLLAKILLRTGTTHMLTAKRLLLAASKLGDSAATFDIVRQGIKTRRLTSPDLDGPRRQLRSLVDEENPVAMYLQGQIYETEGDTPHALKIYEAGTSKHGEMAMGDNYALSHSLGDMWKAMSRLKRKTGDYVGAETAMRTCALQYDNPSAYYHLAKTYTSLASDDYESYLLKAAVSGELRAAHELGVLYLRQVREIFLTSLGPATSPGFENPESLGAPRLPQNHDLSSFPPNIASEKRRQAMEWLSIGAESDNPASQVHLAVLLREVGKSDEGLRWLEKASSSDNWAKAIFWLRELWDQNTYIEIDASLVNKLGTSKTTMTASGETFDVPD